MTIKRILHATDFSPASRRAFDMARALARAFKAELIVLHAWERAVPIAGEGYIPPALVQDLWKSTREHAEKRLARLLAGVRRDGVRMRPSLVEGPPASAIVRAARAQRAGLIVIGTHGRTGVRRFLLGSVAERVVRTATCPVLTVSARG